MNATQMNRRQFLKTSAIAATLVAGGRLPLLAAEEGSGSGIDPSRGLHAVKPIRSYLTHFAPSAGPLQGRGSYTLTYDIVHWDGVDRKTGMPSNSVVGQVVIKRKGRIGKVAYEVVQNTAIGGVRNFIEAQITCNEDDENSVREWKVRFYHTESQGGGDPLSEIRETGTCKDGEILINSGDYRSRYKAKGPVITQWTVLDFLIRKADPSVNATFDLLQDLSLFKANHLLVYDGETRLRLKVGMTVTLQTYVQTGEGVLPVHYLCDERRRPQLVTTSILSWALTSVV